MKSKFATLTGVLAAIVLSVGLGATPAVADDWVPPPPPEVPFDGYEYSTGDLVIGGSETSRASVVVNCTMKVHDPHPSSGAGGAIFKTDITCKGTGVAVVQVRVRGILQLDAAESPTENHNVSWTTRAQSEDTQNVVVNGIYKRFYTPLEGSNGGYGSGFWLATATAQIVGPGDQSPVESMQKMKFDRIFPR